MLSWLFAECCGDGAISQNGISRHPRPREGVIVNELDPGTYRDWRFSHNVFRTGEAAKQSRPKKGALMPVLGEVFIWKDHATALGYVPLY